MAPRYKVNVSNAAQVLSSRMQGQSLAQSVPVALIRMLLDQFHVFYVQKTRIMMRQHSGPT